MIAIMFMFVTVLRIFDPLISGVLETETKNVESFYSNFIADVLWQMLKNLLSHMLKFVLVEYDCFTDCCHTFNTVNNHFNFLQLTLLLCTLIVYYINS